MAEPSRFTRASVATLESLASQLASGKLERRRFLALAAGVGVSLPTALGLADSAAAAECRRSSRDGKVEIGVTTNMPLSDASVARLEKNFESALVRVVQQDPRPLQRPKVKMKRKCTCFD